MTSSPIPLHGDRSFDLDDQVRHYLELADQIERLQTQAASIKVRIRTELGLGNHKTSYGVSVSVASPSRTFNAARAWDLLTEEQKALCVSPDSKKVRKQLPEVLLETCMDEGTGDPRVTIR